MKKKENDNYYQLERTNKYNIIGGDGYGFNN